MTIEDLEEAYDIKFPNKYHEFYDSGIMEWMECGLEEFKQRREEFVSDPHAFMMLPCDCEPIVFEQFGMYMDELEEYLMYAKNDGFRLKDGERLIPFAFMGSGDLYCFRYTGDGEEPSVILFLHDECDRPEFRGKDFDEFLYLMMLDAARTLKYDEEEGEEADWEAWNAHLEYLDDEYREELENSELTGAEYEDMLIDVINGGNADIWER